MGAFFMSKENLENDSLNNLINDNSLDNPINEELSNSQKIYANFKLNNERYNYIEKRVMRGIIFFIVMAFVILFLAIGLCISWDFFHTIIDTKSEYLKNTIIPPQKVIDLSSIKDIKGLLSTGSIITLIAFIFGVGLTLLLTIIKVFFAENKVAKEKHIISDIASPLSKLIEAIYQKLFGKTK